MPLREIALDELGSLISQEIGCSEWHDVTQAEINAFADATHDQQWIHVDVERAKRESPFGGPIAHGYYTLSLAPYLMAQVWNVTGGSSALNYGLNRLRFPSPVLVGSRIRLHMQLTGIEEVTGGVQIACKLTFEIEGVAKPACVAEAVYRYYR